MTRSARNTAACLVACLPIAAIIAGEAPATKPPAAFATLESLQESRNGDGSGNVNITLAIFTEGVKATSTLRRVSITKVTDNEGRPVSIPSTSGWNYSRGFGLTPRAPTANPMLQGNASFGAPLRAAEFIRLEGEIVLFTPSEETGSLVRVANIGSHVGRVESPALSRHNIEVRILDKSGWDEIKGGLQSRQDPEFQGAVVILQRDPSGLLAGFELQDVAGRRIEVARWSGLQSGPGINITQVHLNGPLAADSQLVLHVAVPEALSTLPFKMDKVVLP